MQNIPSNSKFAKLIKRCFIAPKGWVFLASDFNALEDVINTLLTKDPAKRKVLIDGFDGHMFRAFYYFAEAMPDIRLLPEESTEKTYKANIGTTEICFTSSDNIEYLGTNYSGDELYELLTS